MNAPVLDPSAITEFRDAGFLVLRAAFDSVPLSDEVDRVLAEEFPQTGARKVGSGGVGFCALPMMCERTPVSLALVDSFAVLARELVGRDVLPVRAKGTRYFGSSDWHSDSELDVVSIGIAAYLEPLDAQHGALQVMPGSHRAHDPDATGVPFESEPGDVIVFDEHLWHGSWGGTERRQWRVDFVIDPVGDEEVATVRNYYARLFDPDWDGGYDADRYPSYGGHWRSRGRPWTGRLRELGVYDWADAQESAMRARRI